MTLIIVRLSKRIQSLIYSYIMYNKHTGTKFGNGKKKKTTKCLLNAHASLYLQYKIATNTPYEPNLTVAVVYYI